MRKKTYRELQDEEWNLTSLRTPVVPPIDPDDMDPGFGGSLVPRKPRPPRGGPGLAKELALV